MRAIAGVLESYAARLYDLGARPASRSSLADTNAKRPSAVFAEQFAELAARAGPVDTPQSYGLELSLSQQIISSPASHELTLPKAIESRQFDRLRSGQARGLRTVAVDIAVHYRVYRPLLIS